jgi:glucokinase
VGQPVGLVMGRQSPAILASVGSTGVEFALPSARPGEIRGLERIEASECPTFTDALMRFARQHELPLRECRLFISVAGAISGSTIRPTNGRWFISLSGLRAVTASDPMVVNDVAAIAWATAERPKGVAFGLSADIAWAQEGRHAIASAWRGGLGAACVDRTDGRSTVISSEAGHTPFAIISEDDWQMAKACVTRHGDASYERILFDLMDGQMLHRRLEARELLGTLATLLGRYVAEVALTFTAFDGIYLCGSVFDQIVTAQLGPLFRAAFEGHGKFKPKLQQTPTQFFPLANGSLNGLSILYSRFAAR